MLGDDQLAPGALPDLPCACANLRRAARLVTQLYSQEMGSSMDPAQYTLLTAVSQVSDTGQTGLGRILGMDKTTLSRNLQVLRRNGWIEPAASEDRRERGYRLTAEGRRILAATTPGWLRAQARLHSALRPGDWEAMMGVVGRVAEAARLARRGSAG